MKATYKLKLEQHQRRLGLTHNQLNRLDRKHNDVNLLKQLQILNPVASAPTGFYGTFTILNEKVGFSVPKFIQVKLAYNNVDITNYLTINSETNDVLTIPIESRLPSPTSFLQLKIIIEGPPGALSGVDITNTVGYSTYDITSDDPTNENTHTLLVESGFIDGGNLTVDFKLDTT
jgi:hypothetical protein